MTAPESSAIALVRHGRYTSRNDLDTLTEYTVRLPGGTLYIVLEWADGTMSAQPALTYV